VLPHYDALAALDRLVDSCDRAPVTQAVLAAVDSRDEATVANVSEKLGYNKSVVSNHLRSLEQLTFLIRTEKRGLEAVPG
jgi:DNA-binding transcriptional ArsR family regulator